MKRLLPIAAVIGLPLTSSAQMFGPQQDISHSSCYVSDVATADINGDGFLDGLSASPCDNKVSWYPNDGSGGFCTQLLVTGTQVDAQAVAAGDLDNDGDVDVISGDRRKNVYWFANDGSGNFDQGVLVYTASLAIIGVDAVDLDGDGDLDILFKTGGANWMKNDGTGHFTGPAGTGTTALAYHVPLADLDGDGDIDILGSGRWSSNDGTGLFSSMPVFSTTACKDVAAVDLDNDGDLDIVGVISQYNNSGSVNWWPNNGSGVFGQAQVLYSSGVRLSFLVVEDLDGDGHSDVLVAADYNGPPTDHILFLRNDGAVTFPTAQTIATGIHLISDLHLADMDGDGDADPVFSSFSDDKVAYYPNNDGLFGGQVLVAPASAPWPVCVSAADMDGDGDQDVLEASSFYCGWYANDGTGQFGPQRIIGADTLATHVVRAADLDGDGDPDVIASGTSRPWIRTYANDGEGGLVLHQLISMGAVGLEISDLDGDGDPDLLAQLFPGDTIVWFANDGGGNFGPYQLVAALLTPGDVVARDLDADGDQDVLCGSSHGLYWYANDGTGGFGLATVIDVDFASVETVDARDMDGDGDEDVVAGSIYDIYLSWYANDGAGTFGSAQLIDSIRAADALLVDIDQDGDRDVLVAEQGPSKVCFFTNNGAGNFGAIQVITDQVAFPWSVAVADIDADGDPDPLCASFLDDKITWYENLGLSTGSNRPNTPTNVPSVFPNPVHADARVVLPGATGMIDVHVIDLSGKYIRNDRIVCASGSCALHVEGITAGTYLLRATSGQQQWTVRFVKQ